MGQLCIAGASRQLKPGEFTSPEAWDCFLQDNPHLRNSSILHAGTPYVTRTSSTSPGQQCLAQLQELKGLTPRERANIAGFINQIGLEGTLAFASLYSEVIQPVNHCIADWTTNHWHDGVGAVAGGWAERNSVLMKQVIAYQKSLQKVRDAHRAKQPGQVLRRYENDARTAWKQLNEQFRIELAKQFAKVKGRGTVWSSAERGIEIAKNHRDDAKLNLGSSRDIALLRGLARASDIAGNSMLIVESGVRGYKVFDEYRNGGDWRRKATMESSGLALGFIGAARSAALVAETAVAIGLTATPLGWVVMLGVGIAASYFVGTSLDKFAQWGTSSIYDRHFNDW